MLNLRLLRGLDEQVRVEAEIFDRCQRDSSHTFPERRHAIRGEAGDATGKRLNKCAKLSGWQGAVDPTVPFRKHGIVVICAQHDLKCAPSSGQARKVLHAAGAGYQAEALLRL